METDNERVAYSKVDDKGRVVLKKELLDVLGVRPGQYVFIEAWQSEQKLHISKAAGRRSE